MQAGIISPAFFLWIAWIIDEYCIEIGFKTKQRQVFVVYKIKLKLLLTSRSVFAILIFTDRLVDNIKMEDINYEAG